MRRAVAFLILFAFAGCERAPARFDLIVRGGQVFDGVATDPRRVDVGVLGDRITAVGDLTDASAPIEIDARQAVVAPGFIDVQSRAGVSLLAETHGESHLRQGVTTVIVGDLESPAFWTGTPADASLLAPFDVAFDWSDPEGYFNRLQERGISMNLATLVPLTATDGSEAAIESAMRHGALGLSLVRGPESRTTTATLTRLAETLASNRGVLAVHLAGSAEDMQRALDEVLMIAAGSRVPVVIYQPALAEARELAPLMSRIAAARASGVTVGTTMTPPPGNVDAAAAYWLRDSGASVGSQTSAVRAGGLFAGKTAQLRAYDVFADVLARYVREEDTLSLGHAIRQMTSNAAAQFRLENRGAVREGHAADLIVFDPDAIAGRAAADDGPYASGVHSVVVNGVVVVDRTGITGARPGRVVLGSAAVPMERTR